MSLIKYYEKDPWSNSCLVEFLKYVFFVDFKNLLVYFSYKFLKHFFELKKKSFCLFISTRYIISYTLLNEHDKLLLQKIHGLIHA